jgi:PadR family transcriptional regulator AphA
MDIRTLCLGVLTTDEASGYEIKKTLEENFGYFMDVSHGSIYPALAALLDEGLVSVQEVKQEGKPDKKVYALTDSGRAAFVEGLARSPARHRLRSEFLTVLVFANFLPAQRLREVLDARTSEFEQMHKLATDCGAGCSQPLPPGVRFAAGFGAAVTRAAADYIAANRDWLEASAQQNSSLPEENS